MNNQSNNTGRHESNLTDVIRKKTDNMSPDGEGFQKERESNLTDTDRKKGDERHPNGQTYPNSK